MMWARRLCLMGALVALSAVAVAGSDLFAAVTAGTADEVRALLATGADANARADDGATPLMGAAARGDAEMVRVLLEAGADVGASDADGVTALLLAAGGNPDPGVVRVLLEAGADATGALLVAAMANHNPEVLRALLDGGVDASGEEGRGALRAALLRAVSDATDRRDPHPPIPPPTLEQEAEVVRLLLAAGVDPSTHSGDEGGLTPLLLSVLSGNAAIVAALLDAGVDVDERSEGAYLLAWSVFLDRLGSDRAGLQLTALVGDYLQPAPDVVQAWPMLMVALLIQRDHDVVRALLDAGADANTRDPRGMTPLILATLAGSADDVELVRSLLAAGADVNAREDSGWTALIGAAATGDVEILRALLAAGTDADARDQDGGTALMAAAFANPDPEVVRALIAAGADVDARDDAGETALLTAASWNPNPEVVRALIVGGADVDARSDAGSTALMRAASSVEYPPNPGVLRALLEAGADVNLRGGTGLTPLILATVFSCDPEVIRVLVEAGARVDEVDDHGWTALMFAATHCPEAALALLEAGADPSVRNAAGQRAIDLVEANEDVLAHPQGPALLALLRAGWPLTATLVFQARSACTIDGAPHGEVSEREVIVRVRGSERRVEECWPIAPESTTLQCRSWGTLTPGGSFASADGEVTGALHLDAKGTLVLGGQARREFRLLVTGPTIFEIDWADCVTQYTLTGARP